MRTSIATVCISGTLREKLEAIAAAGFSTVEIFENDLIAFPGSPMEVKRICDDLGLKIATCQPFRDFEGMPAEKRQRTFDRAERKFDLLQQLGTDLLFVCSSVSPDAQGGIDRAAADFHALGERAARRGLRVGYEALAWGRYINDYRDSWEIVRRADHPSVGLILDSFHILARRTDLSALYTIPGDRISFVQIADAPLLSLDYLSWARHWRCMPGQGDFDLVAFMAALDATGYDGPLSLEIFNDRFRATSARTVALDGRRSLIWLMDETARKLGRPIKGASPILPPQTVEKIEFIEFVVEAGERASFRELLTAMGFEKTGTHRSKEVELWSQGDIRLVINNHREGFAQSFRMTHGTSVCALALRMEEAQAAIARSSALLDSSYHGTAGQGELNLPAVRGLGGSLLYFVDGQSELGRWHEVDFFPVDKAQTNNASSSQAQKTQMMTAVDHVSLTMPYEEMLTWLLFYASLFDVRKTPSQAVLDPGGVVQSQVIESGIEQAAGGLRLVLNGSQSRRTQSAQFMSEFFGSGVQHIAFNTQDLKATMRRLIANGLSILPIPENYYDDLEARTDLAADEIAIMKSLNILYDQDEKGVFLQAYTTPTKSGFFFEFVERRGYGGYGAANSSIRLAAQSRIGQEDERLRFS